MNIKVMILTAVIGFTGYSLTYAQIEKLTIQDSVRFEKIKDDKQELRALTNNMGTKLALKAQERLGFLMFKEKDYEGAKKEFRALRGLKTANQEINDASYFLGRIASLEKKPEESRLYYEEYLSKEKHGKWREGASYFLIKDMMSVNDKDVVTRIKTHLNEFPPDSTYSKHVQYQLVKYYRENKDYLNAAKEGEVLVDKYPAAEFTADINYQVGGYYYKAGNSGKAKEHFKKIISANAAGTEPNAIGQYLLAKVYDDDGDYKSAREEYKRVKERNANIENWSAVSDYAAAASYYKEYMTAPDSQKYVLAEEALLKHIEAYPLDKRTPRSMMTLANMYSDNKEFEKALETYGKIETFDPSNMKNIAKGFEEAELTAHKELLCQTFLVKGNLLKNELGRREEAVSEYDKALKLNAALHEAAINKAFCLLELGNQEEAKRILEQAVNEGWDEKPMAEEVLSGINSAEAE